MSDLEPRLRSAMRSAAQGLAPRQDMPQSLRTRIRNRRRATRGGVAVLAVMIAAVVALVVVPTGSKRPSNLITAAPHAVFGESPDAPLVLTPEAVLQGNNGALREVARYRGNVTLRFADDSPFVSTRLGLVGAVLNSNGSKRIIAIGRDGSVRTLVPSASGFALSADQTTLAWSVKQGSSKTDVYTAALGSSHVVHVGRYSASEVAGFAGDLLVLNSDGTYGPVFFVVDPITGTASAPHGGNAHGNAASGTVITAAGVPACFNFFAIHFDERETPVIGTITAVVGCGTPVLSPDSKLIASASQAGGSATIETFDAATGAVSHTTPFGSPVLSAAWADTSHLSALIDDPSSPRPILQVCDVEGACEVFGNIGPDRGNTDGPTALLVNAGPADAHQIGATTTTLATTTTTAATTTTEPDPGPRCRASQLTATLGINPPGAYSEQPTVFIANTSPTACTLSGTPTITFLNGAEGSDPTMVVSVPGPLRAPGGPGPAYVRLLGDARAASLLEWDNWCGQVPHSLDAAIGLPGITGLVADTVHSPPTPPCTDRTKPSALIASTLVRYDSQGIHYQ